MPFVSDRDKRTFDQSYRLFTPDDLVIESSFGEVFGASLGLMVDEELSISSALNNEMYRERQASLRGMVDDGFDRDPYTDRRGRIDYDRIAKDTGLLATDDELREQRNEKLRKRREYAEDVIARGSGMAQFTGSMTAFMLDPISIATMGLGATLTTARGLGVTANAMRVAKAEAGIAAATELAIQPLVYTHKLDIESPYSAQEALANIATAAVGGAVLGGIAGGLAGYLRAVNNKADELGAVQPDTPEAMVRESNERLIEDLEIARARGDIPAIDRDVIQAEFLQEVAEELTATAGNRLEAGERKALKSELSDLQFRLENISDVPEAVIKERGVPARVAKRRAGERGEALALEQRAGLSDRVTRIQDILRQDDVAREAFGDLDRIKQGIIPPLYERRLNEILIEQEINQDIQFLSERETRSEMYDQPSKIPAKYEEPKPQKAAPQTTTERQRDILVRNGIAQDFDADIEAFNNLRTADEIRPERPGDRRRRDQERVTAPPADQIPRDQPLEGAPNIQGATGPDLGITSAGEKYARANGIPFSRQTEYVKVDENRAKRIAQAFEDMEDNPSDPAVQEAYRDLANQTRAQYDALVDDGYEFTFFDSRTDPYDGNPMNAIRDLRNNKRMAVYGTYDGFGTLDDFKASLDDPNRILLQDSGLRWKDQNGKEQIVTNNDLFRAVHDAFGHSLEGAGFRARGEENAFQAHMQLFTGPARRAMTTETRGQNSWLNYGPYGETNRTAGVLDTVFADQKMGLMPEWTSAEGVITKPPVRAQVTDDPIMQEILEVAEAEMKPIDDEIENIENVLRCALG